MSETFTLAPLKWRQIGLALVADTIGGATLQITPWMDRIAKRERYAVQMHGVGYHVMPRLDTDAETLDKAQAICDQYHRDRLAEWVVPASQPVLDKPERDGVHWVDGETVPALVVYVSRDQWCYYSSRTPGAKPLMSRVVWCGRNPFLSVPAGGGGK